MGRGRMQAACRAYPEDSRRFCQWSVRFERGADSISVCPAGNQVEHGGRSQVNAIRSSNSGIDRIVLGDDCEGERFLLFPLLRAIFAFRLGKYRCDTLHVGGAGQVVLSGDMVKCSKRRSANPLFTGPDAADLPAVRADRARARRRGLISCHPGCPAPFD
jgi:hypothetical protein